MAKRFSVPITMHESDSMSIGVFTIHDIGHRSMPFIEVDRLQLMNIADQTKRQPKVKADRH